MSNSTSINQKMRDEIANTLTIRAIQDAAKQFTQRFAKLNAAYWDAQQAHVDQITGLTKKKQRELIQEGVMRAESLVYPQVAHTGDDERTRWIAPFQILLDDRDKVILRSAAMFDQSYGPIGCARFSHREANFILKSEAARPRTNDLGKVNDPDLLWELDALSHEAARIVAAAREFRREAMKVLTSCRTSRQLEDLWPEAAKLLPKRHDTGKQVIPKDQVDRVRAQLESGIPA